MDFQLSQEQPDIKNAAREFALGKFPERAQEFGLKEQFNLNICGKAAN